MKYGYCRISTKKQSLERQERNIRAHTPDAYIVKEIWTGTTLDRPKWNWIYKRLVPEDSVTFDSVSRMSRTAEEGFLLYKELFEKGIELIFIKEPHINTSEYREALENTLASYTTVFTGDEATDELVNAIMEAIKRFMMKKIEADIKKAFEQAEKEVEDMRRRTSEGIETARQHGKQIGQKEGAKLHIKKEAKAKPLIIKYSQDFNGSLNDNECIRQIGIITRNTYYKYKKELLEELYASEEAKTPTSTELPAKESEKKE